MTGSTRIAGNRRSLAGQGATTAIWCLIVVSLIALVMPLYPAMPQSGLDPSWGTGMNQAVAQGLTIGTDVIFTFGPYASVYTQQFHPKTDGLMLFGSAWIASGFAAAFWLLRAVARWPFAIALLAVLLGAVTMADTLFFAYLFISGLSLLAPVQEPVDTRNLQTKAALVLVLIPFGLLPLVKGSFLVLALPVCLLALGLLLTNRQYLPALMTVLIPTGAALGFWAFSGQPMAGLASYLSTMTQTVSGYSEAMALNGERSEIIWFVVGAVLLLLATVFDGFRGRTERAYLFLLTAWYLFIVFKAAFVRHDFHALIAGTSILVAALAINLLDWNWRTLLGLSAAFAVWFQIDGHYFGPTGQKFVQELRRHYWLVVEGVRLRIQGPKALELKYHEQLNRLALESGFPRFNGTTDIYSYQQSFLLASGNTWNPRPVFQSYSAYSQEAAEINRQHLLTRNAPDNVLFAVEPIDYRFPAMEDGASWPVLLQQYVPLSRAGAALWLKRLDGTAYSPNEEVGNELHYFGEWVELPATDGLLYAQFDIRPTALGKLAALAFKPSLLRIEVTLANGMHRAYRLISGMTKSTFLLSPLIDNTREFELLYHSRSQLEGKQIRRFRISPVDSEWMWEREYEVSLTRSVRAN